MNHELTPRYSSHGHAHCTADDEMCARHPLHSVERNAGDLFLYRCCRCGKGYIIPRNTHLAVQANLAVERHEQPEGFFF